jgi:plastocyanin
LVFNPQVITAAVGDLINFEFHGGNHTVTQSSFTSTFKPYRGTLHQFLTLNFQTLAPSNSTPSPSRMDSLPHSCPSMLPPVRSAFSR